jgi:hypothetical protein
MLREKRNLALEDLLKIRTRRAEVEVKTEMLTYRQGVKIVSPLSTLIFVQPHQVMLHIMTCWKVLKAQS